jgi:hypothetical protein
MPFPARVSRFSGVSSMADLQRFLSRLDLPLHLMRHGAVARTREQDHAYSTLEALLPAPIDVAYASAVMKAGKVDLGARKADLVIQGGAATGEGLLVAHFDKRECHGASFTTRS